MKQCDNLKLLFKRYLCLLKSRFFATKKVSLVFETLTPVKSMTEWIANFNFTLILLQELVTLTEPGKAL